MHNSKVCLCIHGHFYQPPRENPWLEKIDVQGSASPFHDWNERIYNECYLPNAQARILDELGKIQDVVNNYEAISFNFGPTLMSWIEKHHPPLHEWIIEADRASVERHHGHGNAIAQVYNHMIMPLANARDKVTQTVWGIRDFEYRFGRKPEAIWLAETACDDATLEVLIDAGMKYVILEPQQADYFRSLEVDEWTDVSGGNIDPCRPYRYHVASDPAKHIDIFFYDGPISKDVGFGDLAFNAQSYADRLMGAFIPHYEGTQLIHVATDGETYGHHKVFGDRALAYLLLVEAQKRDMRVVNYGEFLEENPPRHEVRIKKGIDGEGTSWSCAHGVRRWKENCGCRCGGPEEWNQNWRKPLRQALDRLRDHSVRIFEELGAHYLKDVWAARNDYIEVILLRTEKAKDAFFSKHAVRPLRPEEKVKCLFLLEMQRNSMLMYTSCGWFFTEISGIETVQILQYAALVIEVAQKLTGVSHEEEFLNALSEAKSNISRFRDGRGVYEKLAKPVVYPVTKVIARFGMESLVKAFPRDFYMDSYDISILYQRQESYANVTMNFGRVHVKSRATGEEQELVFLTIQIGLYDFRSSVKPFSELVGDFIGFSEIERNLFFALHNEHIVELMHKADKIFGEEYYALRHLQEGEKLDIVSILAKESIEHISDDYEKLFEENRRIGEVYRAMRLPIPEEIRYATEFTVRRQLIGEIKRLSVSNYERDKARRAYRLIEMARGFFVNLNHPDITELLSKDLEKRAETITEQPNISVLEECFRILAMARRIGLSLNTTNVENYIFEGWRKWTHDPALAAQLSREFRERYFDLARSLKINPKRYLKLQDPPQKSSAAEHVI